MTEPRDRPVETRDRPVETRDRTVVTERVHDEPVPVTATVEPANRPLTWGPIWAGVITAFGLFVVFSLLAVAGGLALVEFGQQTGQPAGGDVPVDVIGWIIAALMIGLGFFSGGFVAAWSAWETDMGRGLLNGFLVWALALILLLLLAGLGLGQVFGIVGQMFQFTPGQVVPPDADPQQIADAFRDATWQTIFGIVLAMAAAVLGGAVGTRDEFHRPFPYYTTR